MYMWTLKIAVTKIADGTLRVLDAIGRAL